MLGAWLTPGPVVAWSMIRIIRSSIVSVSRVGISLGLPLCMVESLTVVIEIAAKTKAEVSVSV